MTKTEIKAALTTVRIPKTEHEETSYDVMMNGAEIAHISKGWTRNGGFGWVVVSAALGMSLTKKNLDDCLTWVADKMSRREIAKA
jgi:hypothetical protein